MKTTSTISETLTRFNIAREHKEEDQAKRIAHENMRAENERRRCLGNAGAVAAHLSEVVLPLLNSCADQIRTAGYHAVVEITQMADPSLGANARTFALRMKLITENGASRRSAVLGYEGQFDAVAIKKTASTPSIQSGQKVVDTEECYDDGFRPLTHFPASEVLRQIEEFVAGAFAKP